MDPGTGVRLHDSSVRARTSPSALSRHDQTTTTSHPASGSSPELTTTLRCEVVHPPVHPPHLKTSLRVPVVPGKVPVSDTQFLSGPDLWFIGLVPPKVLSNLVSSQTSDAGPSGFLKGPSPCTRRVRNPTRSGRLR